jgi:hypothetical protein
LFEPLAKMISFSFKLLDTSLASLNAALERVSLLLKLRVAITEAPHCRGELSAARCKLLEILERRSDVFPERNFDWRGMRGGRAPNEGESTPL